jgi:predicted ATPase
VVLISGEPGIGKSRIAQTILDRLRGEPHTRLRFFCSPHHQDTALYPTVAHLERAAGFQREDTDDQRLAKLEALLAEATNDLNEAAPLVAALMSIPTSGRYRPFNLSPQKQREKTLYALLAQVEGLSARKPVLMVFEDVHWSDPTTRELLDLIVERVTTLPVLTILTFRPEFQSRWVGRPQVTLISLSRFAASTARRDDCMPDRRQGFAQGNRRPDHRPHRRRAAVRRGADQERDRERHRH